MNKIETRINFVLPQLNEHQRRIFLAAEAIAYGFGGVKEVSRISLVHANTIYAGIRELNDPERIITEHVNNGTRIRREGGGRKPITDTQPGILKALERLVEPYSYGDPERPLLYTSKSLRKLAEELRHEGYEVSHVTVAELLVKASYSRQQNQKLMQVGEESPDRDEQFRHINETTREYVDAGQPVISVDCKKKENIGNFKNAGAEYAPKGCPTPVLDHDFPLEAGKAVPYGIYDVYNNEGYVSVGRSSDTAAFAVTSIRGWWHTTGSLRFPNADRLFITADGGGSNGSRCRLWKTELQKLANELGLPIEVSHFPPGTSKWNPIEHRLFSQITQNWRGRPLESMDIIVNLISSTTTKTGLNVVCEVDTEEYKTGIKVSDEELAEVNIVRNDFRGSWNYTIFPQTKNHKLLVYNS